MRLKVHLLRHTHTHAHSYTLSHILPTHSHFTLSTRTLNISLTHPFPHPTPSEPPSHPPPSHPLNTPSRPPPHPPAAYPTTAQWPGLYGHGLDQGYAQGQGLGNVAVKELGRVAGLIPGVQVTYLLIDYCVILLINYCVLLSDLLAIVLSYLLIIVCCYLTY